MSINAVRSADMIDPEPVRKSAKSVRFTLEQTGEKRTDDMPKVHKTSPRAVFTIEERKVKISQLAILFCRAKEQLNADLNMCSRQHIANKMWQLVEKVEDQTTTGINHFTIAELQAYYLDIYRRPYDAKNDLRTLIQAVEEGLSDVDIVDNHDGTFRLFHSSTHSRKTIYEHLDSRRKLVYHSLREVDIAIRNELGADALDPKLVHNRLSNYVKQEAYDKLMNDCEVRWFVEDTELYISIGLEKLMKCALQKFPQLRGEKLIAQMLRENSQTSLLCQESLFTLWSEIYPEARATLDISLSVEELITQISAQLPDVRFEVNKINGQIQMHSYRYPQITPSHVASFVHNLAIGQATNIDTIENQVR